MATVKLQLVDPAGHFEYNGTTLSVDEVKEFPNTNEAVKRAIQGRIVRVVHEDNIATPAVPKPAAPEPAAADTTAPAAAGGTKPARPRVTPPTGAAND